MDDRIVTDLAREIYEGFRTWDYRTTDRALKPWGRLTQERKEPFKKIAMVLMNKRKREGAHLDA